MTTLASLLANVSLVPSPTPSLSPPPGQSTGSGSPLWAVLLVGLGGGLLGGAGAFAGAWRSSRSLRQNTEKTLEHERNRLLNERFNTAAELLGHQEAACRLAGVHAMAGLADDWTERRQTCIDVLCAYLRMPYLPQPDDDAPAEQHLSWRANREVRLTVIRIIRDRQQATPARSTTSWDGHDYDFTGAVFDGGDFSQTRFTGAVDFSFTAFTGGFVDFSHAQFTGDTVNFHGAKFTGSTVTFRRAKFTAAMVDFFGTNFTGGIVDFSHARFAIGDMVSFYAATFDGGEVTFLDTNFTGGTVTFADVSFTRGTVFLGAKFTGSLMDFSRAKFTGSLVDFRSAEFIGGLVDLRAVGSWAKPPTFDEEVLLHPPNCLRLPARGAGEGPAAG
ncbi:pentapeptide repeat-containing protein [Kitasatospora cinereorecta]|uniref:Pentapeptide repeat-containing protein n=1 Tax=Kitasatospora cinereorecta TaxID=285560 RepID=A0ABW0VQ58_9ACTN